MNDLSLELKEGPVPQNKFLEAADKTFLDRFVSAPEKVKKIITRGALVAPLVSLIISSGCGNIENPNLPTGLKPISTSTPFVPPTETSTATLIPFTSTETPTPIPAQTSKPPEVPITIITPKSVVTPTETPRPQEQYDYAHVLGVEVAFNRERLPVKYTLPDGKEVVLDKEEVKRARDKAVGSGEPEIVTMILLDNATQESNNTNYEYSLEYPKTSILPKDVLSEDELKSRGVTILQNNGTNLFIRKGAFEKGGLLEYLNNTKRELSIVLLNNLTVSEQYLNDPKYTDIIKSIPRQFLTVENFKESTITDTQKELEYSYLMREKFLKEDPAHALENYRKYILGLKAKIYKYKNLLTNDQIANEETPGFSGSHSFYKDNTILFIFLSKVKHNYNFVTIYINPDGSANSAGYTSNNLSLFPNPNQTHPNPNDFPFDALASPSNPRSYPYGGQTPGLVVRHEVAHDKLRVQRLNKGEQVDESSEYDTDMKAMEGIKNAWEKWRSSGYKDDSGYYFAFSLPAGGYILV